jgi:predicted DCC family thiol-disulfide oxidoreductase YuxK
MNNPIILFDGVCNLCENTIIFFIKQDKKNALLFASLQSETGQSLLKQYNLPTQDFDSFVLIANNRYYLRSSAFLKITSYLGRWWVLFSIFWIVPKLIRDKVYSFISKNRYKWFGQKQECMMPTPEIKAKFI